MTKARIWSIFLSGYFLGLGFSMVSRHSKTEAFFSLACSLIIVSLIMDKMAKK